MIQIILLFFLAFSAEKIWKPRVSWIQQSQMLIMHYNTKQSRNYIILWKNL